MNNGKRSRILIVATVILIIALLFTNITYAKYNSTWTSSTFGSIANFGTIEIKEHEVILEDGQYKFGEKTFSIAKGSTTYYKTITAGMTILKDPFIVVSGEFEVSFELYVKITKKNFPDEITFDLTSDWTYVAEKSTSNAKIYKYNGDTTQIKGKEIYILKDNKLNVGNNFVEKNNEFSLGFTAWIEQVD